MRISFKFSGILFLEEPENLKHSDQSIPLELIERFADYLDYQYIYLVAYADSLSIALVQILRFSSYMHFSITIIGLITFSLFMCFKICFSVPLLPVTPPSVFLFFV
ncbi:hypothetical protein A0O21_08450 [Streptococcus pantholopis]|uniref:Uncharacterized protein n=1 Tax=Streptococcus pantholopis TaxID=1811193 RepID=A0A172Q967_9STRE|nr:hypothetical protein A0O21_08450 [Streptococcus pantholopis]